MSIKITEDCINCGACISECPNNAIYMSGEEWNISTGTSITGTLKLFNKLETDVDKYHHPLSNDFFYIVPEKCTECVGFHEVSQCADVCPVDCCIKDDEYIESLDDLIRKQAKLHS